MGFWKDKLYDYEAVCFFPLFICSCSFKMSMGGGCMGSMIKNGG